MEKTFPLTLEQIEQVICDFAYSFCDTDRQIEFVEHSIDLIREQQTTLEDKIKSVVYLMNKQIRKGLNILSHLTNLSYREIVERIVIAHSKSGNKTQQNITRLAFKIYEGRYNA